MKKSNIVHVLFAGILLAATTSLPVFAEAEIDGLQYEIRGDEAVITYYSAHDESVVIPEEIEGYPVTTIAENAFHYNFFLEEIKFPETLTTIETDAFFNCNFLKDVEIPETVTEIASSAFAGCDSMQNISVSKNNPRYADIDGVLFEKKTKSLFTYPAGKTEDSYQIPEGIKSIAGNAFRDCSYLKEIEIPASVTTIDAEAFSGCLELEKFTVDPKNRVFTEMDGVLFELKEKALHTYPGGKTDEVYIVPEGIEVIRRNAFAESQVVKVSLSDSVTSVEEKAFYSCSKLYAVLMSDYVKKIEDRTFSLSSIEYIDFPQTLESIGKSAFLGCSSLKMVEFSQGIVEIGETAFMNCESLNFVIVPESLSSIGEEAFEGTDALWLVDEGTFAHSYADENGFRYGWTKDYLDD